MGQTKQVKCDIYASVPAARAQQHKPETNTTTLNSYMKRNTNEWRKEIDQKGNYS